jgi:hypothetical protein
MADAQNNGNGCYVITNEGKKFPIPRSLARALEKLLEQKMQTGSLTLFIKSGGVAGTELRHNFEP